MTPHVTPGPSRTYILLEARGQLYCLDMSWIRAVVVVGHATPVPGAPNPLLGVVNIGGRVVALGDLSAALGGERSPRHERATAVVLAPPDVEVAPLAIVADVLEVVELGDEAIELPPSFGVGATVSTVRGVAHLGQERLALVLDAKRLLASFEAGAMA
jgi:purine-binding chemotaxis protein CheW